MSTQARACGSGVREVSSLIESGAQELDLFPGVVSLVGAIGALHSLGATIDRGPVHRAVAGRQAEYAAGRALACMALARLGIEAHDIGVTANRAPAWPFGAVGSISHSMGMVAVAVSRAAHYTGIGLDLEAADGLTNAPLDGLFTVGELDRYRASDLTLIFSAKEALYKLLNPILGRYIDHLEVEIEIEPARREFRALAGSLAGLAHVLECVRGRYLQSAGCWVTCAVITAA